MISLNVQEDSILLHTEPAIVVGETSTVDAMPLEDSPNAVSSGGVYAAIGASDHVKAQNVRFDDGESFQTKLENGSLNGSAGERGPAGKDGHTPIRGTDYWTEADKQEIVEEVLAQGGGESGSYEQFDVRNFSGGSLTTREGYYAYRDNGTNFTYTMPYPQQGAVTITLRFERDSGNTNPATFKLVYADGTVENNAKCAPDTIHTFTSNAEKTLATITGEYNYEQFVYLDLSVMSIVSDYSVPKIMAGATAITAGKHGFVPAPAAGDQDKVLFGDGKWKELPETAASGDFIPSPASAVVGQTVKVSAVDANGKPTAWEAVDFPAGGGGNGGGGLLDGCELIASGVLSEDVGINITKDSNGNDFLLSKVVFILFGEFVQPTSFLAVRIVQENNNWYGTEISPGSSAKGLVMTTEKNGVMSIKVLRADGIGGYWGYGVAEELFHTRLLNADGTISAEIQNENAKSVYVGNHAGGTKPVAGTLYALYGVRA